MRYYSHKEFGHERGLSCCFRQPTAKSHCSKLHGYALAVRLDFAAEELDANNWVMDFGDFGYVKKLLESYFDHTLLVAHGDPAMKELIELHDLGVAHVIPVPRVGCEAFAEMIYNYVREWVDETTRGRVTLIKVTIKEHGANGASYGE